MLRFAAKLSFAFAVVLIGSCTGEAAELAGVWGQNATMCAKGFVKSGGRVTFADDADSHGSGFIVEGDRLRGKTASCRITHRKVEGNTVHLVASCATEVLLDTVQFTLRFVDDNTIARIFPGLGDMEIRYQRCP